MIVFITDSVSAEKYSTVFPEPLNLRRAAKQLLYSFSYLSSFIPGIQSLEMSLDSGSDVLHVCLRPRFVRLTAPANKKKLRAADSEPGDSCQATRVVVLCEWDLAAHGAVEAGTASGLGRAHAAVWGLAFSTGPPLISHSTVSPRQGSAAAICVCCH